MYTVSAHNKPSHSTKKGLGTSRLANWSTVCQGGRLPPSSLLPGHCTRHWTHGCKTAQQESVREKDISQSVVAQLLTLLRTDAVKCMECDSTYHESDKHPGPAPQEKASSISPHKGREGEESNNIKVVVNSNCTEVYTGTGQVDLSWSKICLANVYPKGQTDKTIKAYIILDDQSNRRYRGPWWKGPQSLIIECKDILDNRPKSQLQIQLGIILIFSW